MPVTIDVNPGVKPPTRFRRRLGRGAHPFAEPASPTGQLLRAAAAALRLAAAMNPPGTIPGTVSVSREKLVEQAEILEGGAR
jgi:hypothetical protein